MAGKEKMHNQFLKNKEEIDWNRIWQWLKKGELKGIRMQHSRPKLLEQTIQRIALIKVLIHHNVL